MVTEITKNKRFNYSNTHGWQKDAFLKVMNGLDDKNKRLKKQVKELESENKMLKLTIERNESYIKRLTMKGKWSNTGGVE